jgi:hypothetical protein
MNIFITIIVIVLQMIGGQILGFGLASALQVGNGWELAVIPLGNTLGIWGIGALAAWFRGGFAARPYGIRLIGTVIGSAVGVAIILITPPMGFVELLFPLLGALLGFYLSSRVR